MTQHSCEVCGAKFSSRQELERHRDEAHSGDGGEERLGTPVPSGRRTGASTGGTSGTDKSLREGYDTGDWGQGERGGRDAAAIDDDGDVGDQGDVDDQSDVGDRRDITDLDDVLDQTDVGGGTGQVAGGTGTGTDSEVADVPPEQPAQSSCEFCGRRFPDERALEAHYQREHAQQRRTA